MRPRVRLARFLINLGSLIQSFALMVMRPDDLLEFNLQTYSRQQQVSSWSDPTLIEQGLYESEKKLLEHLPLKQGNLLLLGVGGGREAIPLARLGFQVTGVDFVGEMVEQAVQNARQRGLEIKGLVQDISKLDVPESEFDVVWISAEMYSSIPTKARRIKMLQLIYDALRPGGFFACQFLWGTRKKYPPMVERIRKAIAWLSLGNTTYEAGDVLWNNLEFAHGFLSIDDLKAEFSAGGFEIINLHIPEINLRGTAMLKKPTDQ